MAVSDTRTARQNWAAWRTLELVVQATVLIELSGDESGAALAWRAAIVATRAAGFPRSLLDRMHSDAIADARRDRTAERAKHRRHSRRQAHLFRPIDYA